MKPPGKEYEQVKLDEWINGEIKDVLYEDPHEFPGYAGDPPKVGPATKIILSLDGYNSPKPSFWMWFGYGEKTKLFQTYILPLVEGATPDMDYDLDNLKGMRIRAMFIQKPGKKYQTLSMLRPLESKTLATSQTEQDEDPGRPPF